MHSEPTKRCINMTSHEISGPWYVEWVEEWYFMILWYILFAAEQSFEFHFSKFQIGRFDSPLLDIQQTEEHCGLQYVLRENGEFGVINIGAKRIVTPLQKATGALSPYLFIQ